MQGTTNIEDLAVVYNTTPDEAETLMERIVSILSREKIILAKVGPMLGVHMGPGALIVAMRVKPRAKQY